MPLAKEPTVGIRPGHETPLFASAYIVHAWASVRRFTMHRTAFACCRARDRAGIRMDISRPMMPITTSSSTMVNAVRPGRQF